MLRRSENCVILSDFFSILHSETVKFETLWILSNVTSGTTVQTNAVIQAGAIPKLIGLVTSDNRKVAKQAVWALSNLCGEGAEVRDHLVEVGILPKLTEFANEPELPVKRIRLIAWIACNITRKPGLDWNEELHLFVNALISLMQCNDKQTLVDICFAFKLLIFEDIIPDSVLSSIVHCLSVIMDNPVHRASVLKGAVRCACSALPILARQASMVDNLKELLMSLDNTSIEPWFWGNDEFTQELTESGLRETLQDLMEHIDDEVHEACFNLMGGLYNEEVAEAIKLLNLR